MYTDTHSTNNLRDLLPGCMYLYICVYRYRYTGIYVHRYMYTDADSTSNLRDLPSMYVSVCIYIHIYSYKYMCIQIHVCRCRFHE